MKFISTRGQCEPCTLSEAIHQGLASDGGLFVPQVWPILKIDPTWATLDFSTFATQALEPFFEGDVLESKLPETCARAFNFPIPLKKLDSQTAVLELFHGPTSAFKDFGARFLALCLESTANAPRAQQRMVLVATSGDTGGAVAAAFSECSKIPVAILYPKDKISNRQEIQLTTWGDQVQAFAIKGSFDDCQKLVKQAFLSEKWKKQFCLISANSINIARLLPQMAYFAYASLLYQHKFKARPIFIIPSGNLGNSAAALWAQKLGFPIQKVLFAHNANQTVVDYFQTGHWHPKATVETLANAMDVGNPSNFERIQFLFPDREDLKKAANAFSVTNERICQTVQAGPARWGEVWCPHTATAAAVCERQLKEHPEGHFVIVATAHPAKFEKIVEPLIGKSLDIPAPLKKLLTRASVTQEVAADLQSLELVLGIKS